MKHLTTFICKLNKHSKGSQQGIKPFGIMGFWYDENRKVSGRVVWI